MELIETKKHYIIINGSVALFCDRLSGYIYFAESNELSYEWNPICLGTIKGLIGKLKFFPDGESKLMLINKIEKVGDLPIIGPVYKIAKITTISLNASPVTNLEIDLCKHHHFGIKKTNRITTPTDNQKSLIKGFQEHMKNVKPKRVPWKMEPGTLSIDKDIRDREKFERRMLEEFEKMFQENNNGDPFYLCWNSEKSYDITSNIQRQQQNKYNASVPLWRRASERFFWNKSMLQEAIDSAERLLIQKFGRSIFQADKNLSDTDLQTSQTMIRHLEQLLLPIIQGFVQVKPFTLNLPTHSPVHMNLPNLPQNEVKHKYEMIVGLISRRNRHRAGTRFRRRGVDESGNVANYVETEQFLKVENDKSPHVVSFVQIRGSVPVFWSQFSLKYRPPIILERSEDENQGAFKKHFETELELYDKVIVINLVDTNIERSERKIADAYLQHLIKYNSPKITCVMFDFHDYCRGLQFDNVSILMKGVTEIFRDMKYSWVDRNGLICEQKSIFRVNCVDCLDRTNVVQCMLAGVVIETQLRKLGLLSPEESLPGNFYQIMQFMWANNGDAISRQYSGTAAMKGDFTRTGTRTMNGLVKDGMSSMNRYYLRLREMSRQAAIDLMIGNETSAEIVNLQSGRNDTEQKLIKQKEDNIKELANQCKKACLKTNEECLGESLLIFCNENDPLDILMWNEKEFQDMNTVALITLETIYIVSNLLSLPSTRLDFQMKHQPLAIALPVHSIRKIQIGYELNIFRIRQNMIRVYYDFSSATDENDRNKSDNSVEKQNVQNAENEMSNNFFAFKQPSLRLFNNILIDVRSNNDHVESLKAIAESFYAAAKSINPNVVFDESMLKFEKSKSNPIPSKWMFPININTLYENVILSSSLSALNDDEEDMLNLVDDHCSVLDTYEHLTSNEFHQENISPEKEEMKAMSNIDYIKQSFSRVKDKVKIPNWKTKFSTFSSKNTPLIKLPRIANNKTTTYETSDIDGSSPDNIIGLRKGSLDIQLSNGVEMLEIRHSSTKETNSFLTASRSRLGSSSDDESVRRQPHSQHFDFNFKKSKSGILSFNPHLTSGIDDSDNYPSSNDDEIGDIVLESKYSLPKHSKLINKEQIVTNYKNASVFKCNLSFKPKASISPSLTKFYSSESDLNKMEEFIKSKLSHHSENKILFRKSCGIINGKLAKGDENQSLAFIPHGTAQLAAVTGNAYQRRAERISLQLSIDEGCLEPKILLSLNKSPLLSNREKLKQRFQESFKEFSVSESSNTIPSPIDDKSESHSMISYIQMPSVEIRNPKVLERITTKQIEYAMFIEELRKKTLGIHQPLLTGMIIF